MTKKYRISKKAISDLEKIWVYTLNKWSREQADRYHNLIINEIEYIVDGFDLCQRIDHVRVGYRMTKVKSHLIFFKIAEDNIIEIIRILHQNMDIESRLKEKG
ncbi:type II toxin-antitoxin system RelE/ParE family toxin [Natronoflexus pectinivorans]|uniref:Toxin n=1 Tax=Natronoflexus pectinivorans TaxID=682526 RepID=A0A4R2GIY9_9BACT|nr:type II toxin-antitoxin system RelE/ParE family toxin [Natronoflexus pectinivorans]TCO08375.1 toxin ParE1/3/4 [Natronoflexus pectinivorans]